MIQQAMDPLSHDDIAGHPIMQPAVSIADSTVTRPRAHQLLEAAAALDHSRQPLTREQ